MRSLVLIAAACVVSFGLHAQSCPSAESGGLEASTQSTLHGTLILHQNLREWLGLKLDTPACGESEIQIVGKTPTSARRVKTLAGCRAKVTGVLYTGMTGYYSANLAMFDPAIEPDADCRPKHAAGDPSKAPISPTLVSYYAEIMVDYRGPGRVTVSVWSDQKRTHQLTPWQAYVSYTLTGGGDAIWYDCRKEFELSDTRVAPGGYSPLGKYGNGTGLSNMQGRNTVSFRCTRAETVPSSRDPLP